MKKSNEKTIRATARGIEIFYKGIFTGFYQYEEKGLETLQLYGSKLNGKSYQSVHNKVFNELQNRLYRKLVFGLESVPKSEVSKMSKEEIHEIHLQHRRTQRILNRWKNEITSSYVDKLFSEFFWNSPVTKEMHAMSRECEQYNETNDLSFRQLGLTRHKIAAKLIENGMLPVNFFQLSA